MGVPNQSGANSESEEKNPQQPASFEHRPSDYTLIASRSVSQTYAENTLQVQIGGQIANTLIGVVLDERLGLDTTSRKNRCLTRSISLRPAALRPARLSFPICPRSLASRYSYRSATIGSTRAALLAGIQHARTPVASNNRTVLAKVAGS
jgi:hypothetical protein